MKRGPRSEAWHVDLCMKADFDQIVGSLTDFWDDDRTQALHHPMFFLEFGSSAYVVREDAMVVAYLFGFVAQTGPYGYVHLVAVRPAVLHAVRERTE